MRARLKLHQGEAAFPIRHASSLPWLHAPFQINTTSIIMLDLISLVHRLRLFIESLCIRSHPAPILSWVFADHPREEALVNITTEMTDRSRHLMSLFEVRFLVLSASFLEV